jgi:glycosyltransferase involved in cell wall biosynthesis
MTRRRVSVVTSELLGLPGTGGPGTADSLLALALARNGHEVELLIAPGRDISGLSPEWQQTYAAANVRLRPLQDDGSVHPAFLAPSAHVYDWRALAYAALRSRQLGRSLTDTAFVVYSHGPARVFASAARKVPDTVARFGEEVAQRASFELADVVVSPSQWLVEWLGAHHWPQRPVQVIQNLLESTALGQPVERVANHSTIRRLAFFGQLREGKGIRVFLESLRLLGPQLLDGVELVFLGHTRTWTEAQIRAELRDLPVSIRLEAQLERTAAIAELKRPGTLAVMPSLLENSPYAVAECIEHGVPFLAADVGGTPELVAAEDQGRVLLPPTPGDFAAALRHALTGTTGVEPARPARAPEESLAAWLELIGTVKPPTRAAVTPASRDSVLVRADGADDPDDTLVDSLVAAQAASGADVVTCAVRTPDGGRRLFLGDPGPLGLIENQYGVIGVVRRAAADKVEPSDSNWVFFARLALAGASVVSVPDPAASYTPRSASSAERLAVLEAFEQAGPEPLQTLPQLTATLAAALARPHAEPVRRGLLQRIRRRLLG